MEKPRLGTLLVRHEEVPESAPVAPVIVRSTTFEFASAADAERYNEGEGGWLYGRYENPTVAAVERKLAALEGADASVLFGSGMAAVSTTALALLAAGDELVAASSLYGGTYRLFRDQLARFGIGARFVTPEELASPAAYGPRTKLAWVETPVNPTLRLVDLPAVAAAAREAGVPLCVDATFATPVLLRPLEHGASLVVHSATKALNGHTDLLAGVVSGGAALIERVQELRRSLGGVLDPQAAYELGRGLATLEVRVLRQGETALRVAEALAREPNVASVSYPGLPSHPDAALARRLLPRGSGGMLLFVARGGEDAARRAWDRLRVFRRAVSLGGVESLAALPILSSHTGYSDLELARAGVDKGMMRLSIGLEDPEDLIEDLLQALRATGS